jgi:hypothetical protein
LIDQGFISSLGKEIGVEHGFSVHETLHTIEEYDKLYGDMTSFYARDRGEELCVNKFRDFNDYAANGQDEEYDYILRPVGGVAVWFVRCYATQGRFVTLAEALINEEECEE